MQCNRLFCSRLYRVHFFVHSSRLIFIVHEGMLMWLLEMHSSHLQPIRRKEDIKNGSTHIGKYAYPKRAFIVIVVVRVMRSWNSLIYEMQSYIDFDWLHTFIFDGHQDNTTKNIPLHPTTIVGHSFYMHCIMPLAMNCDVENRNLLFRKYLLKFQQSNVDTIEMHCHFWIDLKQINITIIYDNKPQHVHDIILYRFVYSHAFHEGK